MSRGLDLVMSMDVNSDWIRYSKNEARRKTDYEKELEKLLESLKRENEELKRLNNRTWIQRILK